MSYMKVGGAVVAAVTALAFSVGAYGEPGKSPSGAPGPAGNPNQPATTPQANAPQGPAGNEGRGAGKPAAKSHAKSPATHGKSQSAGASHGNSQSPHGKSGASHGKSLAHDLHKTQSHANPSVGTPRKGGREDRPAGKITICHATKSVKNPYVRITISVNGLHGHGPAADPRHHDGSWPDIIPAPANGCPTSVQATPRAPSDQSAEATHVAASAREVAATGPEMAEQVVLAARAQGSSPATEADDAPSASKVLGAEAGVPRAALAARSADERNGRLPFTGTDLVIVLLAAAAALLGGFALRRATTNGH